MDLRLFGLDSPLLSTIHHLIHEDLPDSDAASANSKASSTPTRTYVRDARAMAATPADVKELPNAYVFVVDMPGIKSSEIKVQIEDENVLVISGERKREEVGSEGDQKENKEEGKYLRMERRMGKFMRKFVLPENANVGDGVTAVSRDGVLTVTVMKKPPPEPKKPKTVEVKVV